jgi:hypothetical protein
VVLPLVGTESSDDHAEQHREAQYVSRSDRAMRSGLVRQEMIFRGKRQGRC